MRIVELTVTKVEFWELNGGDVFKIKFPFDEDEKTLMKCEKEDSANAVDLETGILYTLAEDTQCQYVDATLSIKPNLS